MLQELIRKNRSYRRFFEAERMDLRTLEEFLDNARFSASTANLQPLKYSLVDSSAPREEVFECLKWAGYLSDWPGPSAGERPSAYIVMLHDSEISIKPEYLWCDVGLAAQHILMSAVEKGYGGCMIASVDRPRLRAVLTLPEQYEILLVLALGKPQEKVVLTEVEPSGSIKYYRDADGTHYVPKRALKDLIV
jgi:nitroreductase